ncbi:hypothetical protein FJ960_02320 [Mesorhizobium sp. B2-3-11]|uniref:hypothetical protein n=1 Tax=Mesorhizobium sp. B2-3-11 TaxID=2589953 RepID=UPI0011299270|nr:hypothetical protein [Mesorhizobium sp. B2-3-11]TPM11597.1 hypothetical protein FJ960_02320 [Mesorhizobium sp. B2-3-11]
MTITISAFLSALGSESPPGKLDAAEDNGAHGYRSEHPHGAVNIVGRRASKKECRRLRRGNEKRREAEVSCAIFAHSAAQLADIAYLSVQSIMGAMASL